MQLYKKCIHAGTMNICTHMVYKQVKYERIFREAKASVFAPQTITGNCEQIIDRKSLV